MNQEAFKAGKEAYVKKEYSTAIAQLKLAREEGDANGALDHMLGNAYMRMKMYPEAIASYQDALADESYHKRGAVYANYGRALAGTGHTQEAITALEAAASDPAYRARYKAQMLLGKIFEKQGNIREAGAQFRNAAIDENNPDPAVALLALGHCFMGLGRPIDAIEAYRTALDFSTEAASQAEIYAELGQSFVAANRMQEALDAFQKATADGTHTLTPAQAEAEEQARAAVAALVGNRSSETDALLAAAGYDPLDPLGKSGEFMPSPEDTGFFEVKEEDIVEQDEGEANARKGKKKQEKQQKKAEKKQAKKQKKHHPVRVVFITLLVLCFCALGVTAAGYFTGFGIPSQETVVTDAFTARTNDQDLDGYIAAGVSNTQRRLIESVIPRDASVTIDGVDRSMNESMVSCVAKLDDGGTQTFKFQLVRDGLGWKISNVETTYASWSK